MSGISFPTVREVRRTDSRMGWRHRWDHIQARLGVRRFGHRVEPGLWALGNPGIDAPVLVTANYTLSFDSVRAVMAGRDAWILVLDTRGINVWCAAGGEGFTTEELVTRLGASGLDRLVRHRRLVLPQLGAPGVRALSVRQATGFNAVFGPVRAADLPAWLDGKRDPSMRRVTFTLTERAMLIPVEVAHALPYLAVASLVLLPVGGWPAAIALVTAALAGLMIFPLAMPWIPTGDFSSRGFILGLLAALPFALAAALVDGPWWWRIGVAVTALAALPPVTAFLALNFTGSTPFTSRTGVRREILTYIPIMAWLFGSGLAIGILTAALKMGTGPFSP